MIKKYIEFIKEEDQYQYDNKQNDQKNTNKDNYNISKNSKLNDDIIKNNDINNFDDLKNEIISLIKNTIENNGGEYKSFINSYIKNSEDIKIEGLINDSDIYEFYLKFRNDIDELLNNINYFDNVPSEMNVLGLYDYIIKGTEKAIKEIVKEL
jgi:hypothetical protein